MTGGLVQLASPGAEQTFLIGNDTTYWRAQYHKHTNFALDSLRQDFASSPVLGAQNSIVISRLGDLVSGITLQFTVTRTPGTDPTTTQAQTHYPAENLVRDVTLSIAGQAIDRHTTDFFRAFDVFHRDETQRAQYRVLTNFDPGTIQSDISTTETLYLPLLFSCCRHEGLSLPMISLYNADAKLTISLNDVPGLTLVDACAYIEYVYLDTAERRFFLNNPHTYLVEELQTQEFLVPPEVLTDQSVTSYAAKLGFFRPVKALYFAMRDDSLPFPRYLGDYPNTIVGFQPDASCAGYLGYVQTLSEHLAPISTAKLMFGMQDRVNREGRYFNAFQAFRHGSGCPPPGQYMYSFALRPGDPVQPSGFANFSTLEDTALSLTFKQSTTSLRQAAAFSGSAGSTLATNITNLRRLVVMAWSWNVLAFRNGSAQLAFGTAGYVGPPP